MSVKRESNASKIAIHGSWLGEFVPICPRDGQTYFVSCQSKPNIISSKRPVMFLMMLIWESICHDTSNLEYRSWVKFRQSNITKTFFHLWEAARQRTSVTPFASTWRGNQVTSFLNHAIEPYKEILRSLRGKLHIVYKLHQDV